MTADREHEAIIRELTYGDHIPEADDYTYRVDWSDEDREFVATVDEFPSLSWLDASMQVAVESLKGVVAEVLEDMISRREDIPKGPYA